MNLDSLNPDFSVEYPNCPSQLSRHLLAFRYSKKPNNCEPLSLLKKKNSKPKKQSKKKRQPQTIHFLKTKTKKKNRKKNRKQKEPCLPLLFQPRYAPQGAAFRLRRQVSQLAERVQELVTSLSKRCEADKEALTAFLVGMGGGWWLLEVFFSCFFFFFKSSFSLNLLVVFKQTSFFFFFFWGGGGGWCFFKVYER